MSLTTRRLPPLNAVRAFEAAARQGGFQAAGAELHVSANAVGRLVKILEDWLGVPLFRRLPRGVAPTDAGRDYLDRVTPLLDQLAEATADLQRAESSRVLTVSAVPSFAARWLMPRFGRFMARYPDLDVRVLASVPPTDFAREGVDVAIRLGPGTYEGLRSDLLLPEDFFPVCSGTRHGMISRPAGSSGCIGRLDRAERGRNRFLEAVLDFLRGT